MSSSNNEQYTRFDLSQRIQHVLLIISFTTLSITGLLQLFVGAAWSRWVMYVLGGD